MQGLVTGGTISRPMLDGLYALGKKFPELASEIFVNARPG
jgi:protein involved in polysaccharide export with SLBB domain